MRLFSIQWKRSVGGGFSTLVLMLLTAGCSSFNRDWKAAASMPVQPGDLQGRWQGRWISEVNGHNGDLRCIATKTGNENGTYRARFRATYAGTIKFGYTVPLQAEQKDGAYVFTGDADLGWLKGGVYHYEGHADGMNFFSTYRCKYDHGTFQMGRP
jgi:hypothetical protein